MAQCAFIKETPLESTSDYFVPNTKKPPRIFSYTFLLPARFKQTTSRGFSIFIYVDFNFRNYELSFLTRIYAQTF